MFPQQKLSIEERLYDIINKDYYENEKAILLCCLCFKFPINALSCSTCGENYCQECSSKECKDNSISSIMIIETFILLFINFSINLNNDNHGISLPQRVTSWNGVVERPSPRRGGSNPPATPNCTWDPILAQFPFSWIPARKLPSLSLIFN